MLSIIAKSSIIFAVIGMLFGGNEAEETKIIEEAKEATKIEEQIKVEPKQVTKNEINKEDYTKINNLTEARDDMKVELIGTVEKVYDKDKFIELMLTDCNDTAYPLIVVIPKAVLNEGSTFKEGEEITVYGRVDGLNTKTYKDNSVDYMKLSAYAIVK